MNTKRTKRSQPAGFNMVEVVVALAIITMLLFACLSSLTFAKAERYRDREEGIVNDFLTHYLELLKALPFEEVTPGRPVNALYSGTGGGPRLLIPTSADWMDLTDTNYLAFHPDLVWISGRQPQFRVTLTTTQRGGIDHTRHIKLEVRWKQPLSDRYLTNRLDLVRVKDL